MAFPDPPPYIYDPNLYPVDTHPQEGLLSTQKRMLAFTEAGAGTTTPGPGVVTPGSLYNATTTPTVVPAGKRSITLVVATGTVVHAGGATFPVGVYSWSVDGRGETLTAMTFTAAASSSFYILTTTP